LRSGADAVRINCAHDGPDEWARMVENVHLAEKRTARRCRIMMDLAGPKPRTGEVRTPPDENRLHEGDSLLLSGNPDPRVEISPFQATCTSPEIIRQLQVGQRVLIDDGRMQSRVEVIYPAGVLLRIGGHLVKKTPQLRALQSWPMERNIRPGLDAGPVLISSRRTRGARSARCPV